MQTSAQCGMNVMNVTVKHHGIMMRDFVAMESKKEIQNIVVDAFMMIVTSGLIIHAHVLCLV